MANNKVYIAEVERFGYTLTAMGKTEREAKDAIIAEYVRAYMDENEGSHPIKDEHPYGGTYYDNMLEDLSVEEIEFGVVEWR